MKGIAPVKISEPPMAKVHKLHGRRDTVRDETSDNNAELCLPAPGSSTILIAPHQSHIGALLIEEGCISESQLQEALKIQAELETYKPLGQILVEQKAISTRQLNLFMDKHHKRARLGEILLKSQLITGEQLEVALSYQKTTGLPLGEMLVKLNYISEEVMRQALCKHLNIPFIDLEKFSIDPDLRKLINKSYAKNNRVLPVSSLGNTITLAMEDPTNTGVIKELKSSTGLTINIVTSTSSKIRNSFAKLYGEELIGQSEPDQNNELISDEADDISKSRYTEDYQQTQRADEAVRKIINIAVKNRTSVIYILRA
jgi:hypothetical protein